MTWTSHRGQVRQPQRGRTSRRGQGRQPQRGGDLGMAWAATDPFEIPAHVCKPSDLDRESKANKIAFLSFINAGDVEVKFCNRPQSRALECIQQNMDVICVSFSRLTFRGKVLQTFVESVVVSGLHIGNAEFLFFGSSNSQLKTRTAYMVKRSNMEISEMISKMGDFDGIRSAAKMAKRLGLLFSEMQVLFEVPEKKVRVIKDIYTNEKEILTDGCGLVSSACAKRLAKTSKCKFRSEDYTPSVFQVRYLGYKGVLMVDPTLRDVDIEFRDSMKKLQCTSKPVIGVVGVSRPYQFGAVNAEHATLLVELGVPVEMLVCKAKAWFELLQDALHANDAAMMLLLHHDDMDGVTKVVHSGLEGARKNVQKAVLTEVKRTVDKHGKRKVRFGLLNSRLLYGVCEPESSRQIDAHMGDDEVYVRITLNGQPTTLTDGFVMVTRNPCLHPGDFRKLRLVDVPQYAHLVDCIVFSNSRTQRRCVAMDMAGGDLDGDMFMVIFDSDLITTKVFHPAEYAAARQREELKVTQMDRARYFARFNNASLGYIKNLYLRWVAVHQEGAKSREAVELANLFASCVDGQDVPVREELRMLPMMPEGAVSVIDTLVAVAEQCVSELQLHITMPELAAMCLHQTCPRDSISHDIRLLESLVFPCTMSTGISSFEALRLVQDAAKTLCTDAHQVLLMHIDYASMSAAQRRLTLSKWPELADLMRNAVQSSAVVNRAEAAALKLTEHDQWKRMYTVTPNIPNAAAVPLLDAMTKFKRKLIVILAGPKLTLLVLIRQWLVPGVNELEEFDVRATDHNGFRSMRTLSDQYFIDIDDDYMQIYRGSKNNSFVWLSTDVSHANFKQLGHPLVASISVDLSKIGNNASGRFARIKKDAVHQLEIYVAASKDDIEIRHCSMGTNDIPTQLNRTKEAVVRSFVTRTYETMMSKIFEDPELQIVHDMIQKQTKHINEKKKDARKDREGIRTDAEKARFIKYLICCVNNGRSDLALEAAENFGFTDQHEELPVLVCMLDREQIAKDASLISKLLRMLSDSRVSDVVLHLLLMSLPLVSCDLLPICMEQAALATCIIPMRHLVRDAICNRQADKDVLGLFVDLHSTLSDGLEKLYKSPSGSCTPNVSRTQEQLTIADFMLVSQQEMLGSHRQHSICKTPDITHMQLKQADKSYVVHSTSRCPSDLHIGDILVCMAMRTDDVEEPLYAARVTAIDQPAKHIEFLTLAPVHATEADWKAWHIGNATTSRMAFAALRKPLLPQVALASATDDPDKKLATLSPDKLVSLYQLNASQADAVHCALSNSVALIWGPPAVGKTYTIVALIRSLLDLRERILVTASTHAATNNILTKFASTDIDKSIVVRIGEPGDTIPSHLRCFALHLHPRMKDAGTNMHAMEKKIVREMRIVFCTVAGSGLGMLQSDRFDTVIVDEAAQLPSPHTKIAITKARRRIVLVGDHKQLQPIVHIDAEKFNLHISYFEQLLNDKTVPVTMLSVQHRMHPELIAFSNRRFYEGKISSDPATLELQSINIWPWTNHYNSFLNISGSEQRIGCSYKNAAEASCVASIVDDLVAAASVDPLNIVVITGYAAQVATISGMLLQRGHDSISVRSIDAVQGQEGQVVIFSAVRTGSTLGFLGHENYRRVNVMLTRAKRALVVVGSKDTLMLDDLWQEWIKSAYKAPCK